tara:strand:+ start:39 stop:287 length:249 start_codon:yes stop_codon:yes gene_type:complete
MKNNENNYDVNVNNVVYNVTETQKNGVKSMYVQNKSNGIGVQIKGKRNEPLNFEEQFQNIIKNHFEKKDSLTNKWLNRHNKK